MTLVTRPARLAGKRWLVTAAAKGIGRAITLAFAAEGAEVLATDVDPAGLSALAAEVPGLRTAVLDVRRMESVQALVGAEAAFDGLAACAGFVHAGALLDSTEAEWEFAWDLNVRGMERCIRAVLPGMIASGRGGSILTVASVVSSIKGVPNRAVYATTKAAVIGLTKAVAADYIGARIRANAICPGTIDTPSLGDRIKAAAGVAGSEDAARAAFVARQPLGRLGTAEEVAALALHLAGDEAGFTTGAVHVIDGGFSL